MEKIPKSRKQTYPDRRNDLNRKNNLGDRRKAKNTEHKEKRRLIHQDYTPEMINERINFIREKTGVDISDWNKYTFDPQDIRKNIEHFIGAVQVPLGICGPLLINGEYAKGEFYIPMATTEASLVMTYELGARVITASGGVTVSVIQDKTHIAPVFLLESIQESKHFCNWIKEKFNDIKQEAESTTNHGKLQSIDCKIMGRKVITMFNYTTGDAAGQNMVSIATDKACRYIKEKTGYHFYLKSNMCSDKKPSYYNFINGYGKSVQAEIIIPGKILSKFLHTTAKEMYCFLKDIMFLSGINSGGINNVQGHFANGLTALFIACGQDVAHIANSCNGYINFELKGKMDEDLYVNVYIPSLITGTIGGGTSFGAQKKCLEILGCYGKNLTNKFAEISTALVLSGELSIISAVINDTFADGHNKYRSK